ncbi:hypothetical protein [Geoglobus acetivorans]|uniref:Uncharacterized protein n=1 Tax=Geoglobus acetivorans TaxID=565033 RepID=A0A0A7GGZ6_GEOAI|nr:hypothetical protein GACE_2116 [Geoglobus acetivorans]
MSWRIDIWPDVCNYKKIGKTLILFQKPRMTRLIGENIYIYAVSKKGRTISIRLTLDEAKRLARELNEQLETRKRVDSVIALMNFRDMFCEKEADD